MLETLPAVGKDMLETWSWLSASSDVYSSSSKGSVARSVRIVPQEWAPAPFFLMDLSRPDLDSELEVLSVSKYQSGACEIMLRGLVGCGLW